MYPSDIPWHAGAYTTRDALEFGFFSPKKIKSIIDVYWMLFYNGFALFPWEGNILHTEIVKEVSFLKNYKLY